MPIYYDDILRNQGVAADPVQARSSNVVTDSLKGILYGAVESVHSAYGLADYLSTGVLPDWDNPISAPNTGLGRIVGAASQFFVPYAGLSKGLSALSGAVGIATKGGRALSWLSGGSAPKALIDATVKGRGSLATALLSMSGRATLKGGAVDFLAFEGSSERLSDVIQTMPTLANPITAFLSSDADDGEVEGRFKNVLEGAGLGVMFDGLLSGFRFLRARNAALKNGASLEDATRQAALKVEESAEAAKKLVAEEQAALDAIDAKTVFDVPTPDGAVKKMTGAELNSAADEIVQEALGKTLGRLGLDEGDLGKVAKELQDDELLGELRVNPRTADLDELTEKRLEVTDQNREQYVGVKDFGTRIMRALERAELDPKVVGPDHKTLLAEALVGVKHMSGVSVDEFNNFLVQLSSAPAEIEKAGMRSLVARYLSEKHAVTLFPQLRELLQQPDLTFEQTQKLVASLDYHTQLQVGARKIMSSTARVLNSAKIKIDSDLIKAGADGNYNIPALDFLSGMTKETFDATKAKKLLADLEKMLRGEDPLDNIRALNEWLEAPVTRQTADMVTNYQINALLSGPATHVVNFGSGVFMSFYRPLERALGFAASGDLKSAKSQLSIFGNLLTDFTESYRLSRQVGDIPFTRGSKFQYDLNSISNFGKTSLGNKLGGESLFGPLGRAINLPSSFLQKQDRLIKIWNGRSTARQVMMDKLIATGMGPGEAMERAQEMLSLLMKNEGAVRSELALARAAREAGANQLENTPDHLKKLISLEDEEIDTLLDAMTRGEKAGAEATFTNKLAANSVFTSGANALNMFNKNHPLAKLFIPFVNTPTNIAQFGWDRTLGAALGAGAEGIRKVASTFGLKVPATDKSILKLSRDLVHPDPWVRSEAKVRMLYGLGFVASVMAMASYDEENPYLPSITGSGPTDPDIRKAMEASGWQPFSVRIGDTYVSYSRLDPVATLVGLAVDAAEVLRESVDDDKGDYFQSLGTAIIASVANNLTSKTYAQGISNMLEVIQQPEKHGPKFLGATLGTFVPTIAASTEKALDPEVQEIRSIADRIRSRIPGLSQGLPEARNILGEPIVRQVGAWEPFLPLRLAKVKDSVLEQELARFAYGFSTPSTKRGGVDLLDPGFADGRRTVYDDYTKLVGEVQIGGVTLRQALRKKIQSPAYQRLDPESGPNGERSPRVDIINAVLRRYRDVAWKELLRREPELREAVSTAQAVRSQRRRGTSLYNL